MSEITWKEVAISHAEFNLNVYSVGVFSFDEWRPQPVVHIIVGDVANNIRSPVNTLLKIRKTFFNPLRKKIKFKLIILDSF